MDKKLAIFGGSGFVGGNLAETACKEGWRVYIVDSFYRQGVEEAEWKNVNITDRNAIRNAIDEIMPDAVVNVAAIADVDKAEQDKELAWNVNVAGAQYIAECCAEKSIKYIFFSSDAVFDGKKEEYSEESILAPVNYYGQTKAEAERAVLMANPDAVVIRISLVIGFPVTGGNSFLASLDSKLKAGIEVFCPAEEIRTPIDVLTLCECVIEFAGSNLTGVFHLGSTDSINRYDLTRKVAELLRCDVNLIKRNTIDGNSLNRAPRHRNGIINVSKAQKTLKTKLLGVDESIARAVSTKN